ncbi:hypothetical protein MMC22_008288 [Lobaria immixta]|nr:hypothetical protein [Lobaria immixta]
MTPTPTFGLNASSTSPGAAPTPVAQRIEPPCPRRMIVDGVRNCSTAEISRALQLDRSLLPFALSTAVRRGSVLLTRYLLVTESAPANTLTPLNVVLEASVELLDLVVTAGWDLNKRSLQGKGDRLLDLVAFDEGLVKWCLEHGAQVSDGAEKEDAFTFPPLTERVAALGTVSIFKIICAKGAHVGQRTLHRAAESAAKYDTPQRVALLRFLVEDVQLDVNRMDTDGQMPDHWGTPIAYAAKGKSGENVVRYLLAKGADPRVKDCWGIHDALSLAELCGNKKVAQVLRESTETNITASRRLALEQSPHQNHVAV